MKFGAPLVSTELSGALGGLVGATARGGVGYFRARIRPSNPRSPAQAIMRAILTGISAAWAFTLTGAQRTGWETISPPESSGIDSFNKVNSQVLLGGDARVDDPPASLALTSDPITAAVVVDESAATIGFTIPAANGDVRYNVYATAGQSASRLSRQFGYRFVATSTLDATGATTVAIPATHPAADAAVGKVVYVRMVPWGESGSAKEGQVGTAQEFRVTVTA